MFWVGSQQGPVDLAKTPWVLVVLAKTPWFWWWSPQARLSRGFPVVPVGLPPSLLLLSGPLQRRAGVLWGPLGLGGAGVQLAGGLVGVEGPVVLRARAARGPVLRRPPEVLSGRWRGAIAALVVVGGAILIRAPPLGVRVPAFIVRPMSPVVSVVAVLVVGSFPRGAVVAVTS